MANLIGSKKFLLADHKTGLLQVRRERRGREEGGKRGRKRLHILSKYA